MKTIESFVTWQGEGVDTGQRMLILRFKKCNRKCLWCDTAVKMRTSMETEITLESIQEIVNNEKCGIMVTGGEPTYQDNLKETVGIINKIDCSIFNVETNGFDLESLIKQVNPGKNVNYSLSPKLFKSDDLSFYIDLINKIENQKNVYIKLVYEERDLVIKFLEYLKRIEFDNNRIFLMPEGAIKEEILKHAPIVFDAAEKYKVNFSSREHIIYGFV